MDSSSENVGQEALHVDWRLERFKRRHFIRLVKATGYALIYLSDMELSSASLSDLQHEALVSVSALMDYCKEVQNG